MTISIKYISALLLSFVLIVTSCKKEEGPLSDVKPAIPVTVQNAVDFRPEPTVSTVLSGTGTIQIVLSIPSGSGRSIKEISKVAASTTYSQIQSTGTTGFYTTGPISASGTTVTFNTSITEYLSKYPTPAPVVNTELSRRFYFLVTLDDGSQIVTEPVRILVL